MTGVRRFGLSLGQSLFLLFTQLPSWRPDFWNHFSSGSQRGSCFLKVEDDSKPEAAESGCMEVTDISGKQISAGAAEATKTEHDLTFRQAIRLYKKAVIWSLVVSLATK